jgi:CDP-glucose 4,6-dehydratase
LSKAFWKNKRVLVTGYAGFLGSHLVKNLLHNEARVTGLDIKVRPHNQILENTELSMVKDFQGNAADFSLVYKILRREKPEIIFHLAAEALVGRCLSHPRRAFRSNITGTWTLLEACRQYGQLEAIICASSDKAYGRSKDLPYRETFALAGEHPYDVSKSCADLIARTYFHTFNLPVAVVRSGNIFGPGDFNFSRLVPDCIRAAIRGQTFKIRSNGRFTRDYVYIEDAATGYLKLAEQLREKNLAGEAFNFSLEQPVSVLELVQKIYRLSGKIPKYQIRQTACFEIPHQYLSARKARQILGWRPLMTLDGGLKITIDWYRKYLENSTGAARKNK